MINNIIIKVLLKYISALLHVFYINKDRHLQYYHERFLKIHNRGVISSNSKLCSKISADEKE